MFPFSAIGALQSLSTRIKKHFYFFPMWKMPARERYTQADAHTLHPPLRKGLPAQSLGHFTCGSAQALPSASVPLPTHSTSGVIDLKILCQQEQSHDLGLNGTSLYSHICHLLTDGIRSLTCLGLSFSICEVWTILARGIVWLCKIR